MKLNAINKIKTPNFIKNIMLAAPLIAAAPFINALEKSPAQDKFEKTTVSEEVIPIHPNDSFSPEIKVGDETVYPAIVVDKSENQLYFYDLDGNLDTLFKVGLGKPSTPTDTGLKVITRIEDYPYKTASPATKRYKTPNDYGPKVIILDNVDTKTGKIVGYNGEFIHGTDQPSSVGKNQSKGCIRMYNEDVEKLASWVSKGQYVLVRE